MNRVVILALVAILATANNCRQGELLLDGACHPCEYIPGCAQYGKNNICRVCEFGYQVYDGRCNYVESPTDSCCSIFRPDGSCESCAPGLILDGSSCYKVERPGCLEGEGLDCLNCATGYEKIAGKCFRKIRDCLDYSISGACNQCQDGYELIRGLCSKITYAVEIPNCEVQNEYGCVECDDGFYLKKDRSCQRFRLGCLKYFRGECQICAPGLTLIDGECRIQGCTEYGREECTLCGNGYTLIDGRCLIQNCQESLDGQCLVCSKNFRIRDGKCVQPITDRCTGCADGYFIGENGRCYKQLIGCIQYNVDGRCSICNSPFVLNQGQCIIPGCQKIGQTGCTACKQPFLLFNNGRCGIEYCLQNNFNRNRCQQCQIGFHIHQGLCLENDPLCARYSFSETSQICTQCIDDNYILNEDGVCEPRRPGCVYQYGRCISCAYPFKQFEGDCIINGCEIYAYDGCLECDLPFMENRGSCVIPNCEQISGGVCLRCRSGFHVNLLGQCQQKDPRCESYLQGVCQKCLSGYTLSTRNRCIVDIPYCAQIGPQNTCEKCQLGYDVIQGSCQKSDPFCVNFAKDGCLSCEDGRHTENARCVRNDPFCKTYSGESVNQKCVQCVHSYFFSKDGSRCIKSQPGCKYTDGKCSSCSEPFVYFEGACRIGGCEKYSEKGCYECAYPFKSQGDICVIPFCHKYSATKCEQCESGYKLIQGKCFRNDPKCVEYDNNGNCKVCINGCTLFEGICITEDKFCETYSKNGGCNKCKKGYYTSNEGVCLPEQPGCIYQKGVCKYCQNPFVYDEANKICRISGCLQLLPDGCKRCRNPFQLTKYRECEIPNCVTVRDNACARCSSGYHVKQGLYCVKDDPSCLRYNGDGDCEKCDYNYILMSNGECQIAEDNCLQQKNNGKCLACKENYFLNRFFQCQLRDENCEEYNNGVCVSCTRRYFLYDQICFPYSPGCVAYSGKDCVQCKKAYELREGECFLLKKPLLKLEGEDDEYDFEITPIDITKSKYYIDNLSPISKLGKVFYSSFYSKDYTDCRLQGEDETQYGKGWKAENKRDGQYIGYIVEEGDPVTFYAIQLEGIEGSYLTSFYLEYSLNGVDFIRIEKPFNSEGSGKDLITIYFTAVYAKAIRIVIKGYAGWPATRMEFYYYDHLRFRKISNLKSLRYLKETIQSNFVDRIDNQLYINSHYFFTPKNSCSDIDICFTGLELCQPRTLNSVTVACTGGTVDEVYLTYSIDGQNFNCFEKCRHIVFSALPSTVDLYGLLAKNVRVYPVKWTENPSISVTYDYQ